MRTAPGASVSGVRVPFRGGAAINAVRFIHLWLGRLTAFIAGTILAAMTILVFLTVIYRYFLLAPISWGEEMARFLFIALSMLGASLAMKDRSHFAITILTARFPAPVRAWLEVVVALGATALLAIVIDKGWSLTLLNQNQISPALGVPMSIPYLAVPLGATLMVIFLWMDLVIKRQEG
ncbi:MAG TPA: TRAP transporter small permease, partial [Candidatus Acidoferrum sp.]|nr:TRAP transporter small permease [Candidatus Acidoferrum sp.]